jgi:hypothetical protein
VENENGVDLPLMHVTKFGAAITVTAISFYFLFFRVFHLMGRLISLLFQFLFISIAPVVMLTVVRC